MEQKRRYTTMVFPQGFDGTTLSLNIVLIPRNQNPFDPYPTGLPAPDDNAIPFADLNPQFEIKVVKGLDEWPMSNAVGIREPKPFAIAVEEAVNKKALLQGISNDLGIKINVDNAKDKAESVDDFKTHSVNKYLPESYRNSFNFISPRHKNAKTDDSYHCAVRNDTKKNDLWKNSDELSWGQVFGYILRQPLLAKACGMIYSAEINVAADPTIFEKGCYIYADIINDDYSRIQKELLEDNNGPFIKRYAARLPKLIVNETRPVFAPLLFPVMYRKIIDAVDPEPKGQWDKIFAELNEYNDGFAKIVHAQQPVSSNLLSEHQDGAHPVKDVGIRLAWDDEQILIWYIRQLEENPEETGSRLDAPLGVFGYRIDVREQLAGAGWNSLNLVRSKQVYSIGDASLGNAANQELELPFQVFPTQLDNNKNSPYWLPMYFTNWIGKSLVLKDSDSIKIYKNTDGLDKDDKPKNVESGNMFEEIVAQAELIYGRSYEFRVRMMDISGGGPTIDKEVFNNAATPSAKWDFKRYIAPSLCRIEKPAELLRANISFFNESIVDGVSQFDANPVLNIKRPLLNYPAVVFTGKYQDMGLNPVQLLIDSVDSQGESKIAAIADPDVIKCEIKVEVETLRLDNLLSESGRENYVTLYTTTRNFSDNDMEAALNLQVVFHDVNVLNLGNQDNPFNTPTLNKAAINAMQDIPLPTARKIRITVRGVCEGDGIYYGHINEANPDLDTRYGKTTQFWMYKESGDENELLLPKANVSTLQGIYLQPDPILLNDGKLASLFLYREKEVQMPDMVHRLAIQLGVKANGLTLTAKKGQRVVFGCNSKIRHHLAPDQGSITFSSKGDLENHWLGCIVYRINRDWSWDALQDTSFIISRTKKFSHDADDEAEVLDVLGDIEVKHYASFESLQADDFGIVDRSTTTIIFIDAIEPKTSLTQDGGQLRYPDELEVKYAITPNFKPGHGNEQKEEPDKLDLPSTIIPSQVPQIASVGIAFSQYIKNEKYSATEPRQRYLWIELKEPVKASHDTIFCRLLHYAPDQMISNNIGISTEVMEDPPLPVDPEYIRSITPNQTDDMAGLSAMQAMEKAGDDDDIHYLLPLPPGLHPESPELFGFFTYEFRIGHGHWSNGEEGKENLWSTAQGRFGRPLRVTGMQHPAPTLLCQVNRDPDQVYASAPYAEAVWKGKNVTANPPRTQLHCLLYAQVKQANGIGYRNILLGEKLMALPPKTDSREVLKNRFDFTYNAAREEMTRWSAEQVDEPARAGVILSQLALLDEVKLLEVDSSTKRKLNRIVKARTAGKTAELDRDSARKVIDAFKLITEKKLAPPVTAAAFTTASLVAGAKLAIEKDEHKTAEVSWTNKEISALLAAIGLPGDSPLSVLAVEVFGNITSIFEHIGFQPSFLKDLYKRNPQIYETMEARRRLREGALSEQLGNYRILRTSPLTEVPFVCCVDC